jgi:large subunit ribosomal protein L3
MNWWVIIKKQEMSRIRHEWSMVAVTLVSIPDQHIVRYKTTENDWYNAVVVGCSWSKSWSISFMKEFNVDWEIENSANFISNISLDNLYTIVWTSKGKWFQGVIKRHHFAGGPASHGSKFHRWQWSTGNRKPRRTHKNHPMAGHMWSEIKKLKKVKILNEYIIDNKKIYAIKWSLPWAYNSYLFMY